MADIVEQVPGKDVTEVTPYPLARQDMPPMEDILGDATAKRFREVVETLTEDRPYMERRQILGLLHVELLTVLIPDLMAPVANPDRSLIVSRFSNVIQQINKMDQYQHEEELRRTHVIDPEDPTFVQIMKWLMAFVFERAKAALGEDNARQLFQDLDETMNGFEERLAYTLAHTDRDTLDSAANPFFQGA